MGGSMPRRGHHIGLINAAWATARTRAGDAGRGPMAPAGSGEAKECGSRRTDGSRVHNGLRGHLRNRVETSFEERSRSRTQRPASDCSHPVG